MALNEFMSRQVRRKQKPEFNPGFVPGVSHPSSPSSPPPPLRRSTRILIIHTSLPLHFISYCCHCTLFSIAIYICHLRPLFTCTACCLLLSMVPGQPRQFYAHTMKRFSHLSSHRTGPYRLSTPQAKSRWPRKDNEFPGKMFGLIDFGAGSAPGNIEWFGFVWFIVCHV